VPLSGWFLMNSLRIICSTFIDWFAHSMRFLPRSASSNPFTSLLIDVVAIFSPDERSEVRGQIAEVTPDPNSFLLRSQFFVRCCFCGSGFLFLPLALTPRFYFFAPAGSPRKPESPARFG